MTMKKKRFTSVPFNDRLISRLQVGGRFSSRGENTDEAKAKLESTLDVVPIVYALTVDNILAEVNEYTRSHIGMEPGEDIRQFCQDIVQWNTLINAAGQNKQEIINIKMKSGEVRQFLGSVATISYQSQKAYILWGIDIGYSGIVEGIKAREDSSHISQTADENEREANRLKGKILSDISHEIRTPMNGIIGMTDLLLGEKISGRKRQYVTDIKKSAESLQNIVDDILDYAKICEGKMQILPVDVELRAFLKNIVAMMRFSAQAKGLEFKEEIQIKPLEFVKADDLRLKQILLNLLSNAIKFTKAGGVTFLVKIEHGDILFKVSDTGIGIKQEDIPLLFTAFSQVDESKNRGVKGIGLGLSISKKLVNMMGGKIWIESEYGVGSHFCVSIPYSPGEESAVKAVTAEFQYIYAPTANILLVDDIQSNLTVTAGLLRLCGITADIAMSGMEAVNLVCEKDYDIIFMDYMMPEMNGVEAMKKIRSLGEKHEKLPIIALTADSVSETRDFLLGAGMDGFLSKPLDKSALMDVLKKWLPIDKIKSVANHDISGQNADYSKMLQAVSLIEDVDIELALSRLSGMQNVLESSLTQVAKSIGGYLREMDSHLSGNNLKDFSIVVHGAKSALANIGATRHSEMAAELEILSKSGNLPQCKEKFVVFADIISCFAEKLNNALSHTSTKDLPQGDQAFLIQKAAAAVSFLQEYEISEARSCIKEMLSFTYDEITDKLLNDIGDSVEAANYKNAITLLKSINL